MPSAKRRIARRVAYSLFTDCAVRSEVPISALMFASISSVNLALANSVVILAGSTFSVSVASTDIIVLGYTRWEGLVKRQSNDKGDRNVRGRERVPCRGQSSRETTDLVSR